ncbi:translationally-controlled tumor protein homolog isoform 2-T2 [Polymixia lowei]
MQAVTRSDTIDDSMIGGNASAVDQMESCDAATISGVDIVLNSKLQETSFSKEAFRSYIKGYLKAVKAKLEENKPERVNSFMTGAAAELKNILSNFKNYQFFIGESMNPEGMVGLMDYRPDGSTPFMIFFKDGLELEKC